MQRLKTLRKTLKHESVGPIIRRFFINTLFDSTFMLLGIIVGSAFAGDAGLNVIIVTMLTTSLALGISTGVSVYEAESLEQERKIADLEKALFTDLQDTSIQKTAKYTILIATSNQLCNASILMRRYNHALCPCCPGNIAAKRSWVDFYCVRFSHIICRRSLYGPNGKNKSL